MTQFKSIEECGLQLVSHSNASDFMPCSAARVSFGNEDKTGNDPEGDVKLMKYLADHQHMTPFEYQHAVFMIEVPLFIRSQIHRHRTFSFNEISRRYTSDDLGFYLPDEFRGQSKSNRQASAGVLPEADQLWLKGSYKASCVSSLIRYEELLKMGVAREIARAVLPQALLTRFYMGGNLRAWSHFIALRRDPHAQYEVQVVAERVSEGLRGLWPKSCEALGI